MASTVSELLVRIRPEGAGETADELEQMGETFEETADSAGEQMGMLEEFSQKWQNAMSIVVAGLAVASAGLLANVPVLGEAFAGLRSIMNAVAFQMDEVLRPIFGPLSNAMFNLSNAIYGLEGAWGTLVGIAGTVVSVLSLIAAGIASVGFATGGVSGAIGALSGAFSVVAGAITTAVTAIVGFVAAVAGVSAAVAAALVVAIAAVVAFVAAYITNFMGVRDRTNEIIGQVIEFITGMAKSIATTLTELVQRAFRAGRGLIDSLIDGLRSRLSALRAMVSRVAGIVRSYLPGSPAEVGPLSDIDKAGPGLVDTFASGMERGTGRIATASRSVAGAAAGGGASGGGSGVMRQLESLVREMSNNSVELAVNLDSRELARGVEPLIAGGAVNSGATRVSR